MCYELSSSDDNRNENVILEFFLSTNCYSDRGRASHLAAVETAKEFLQGNRKGQFYVYRLPNYLYSVKPSWLQVLNAGDGSFKQLKID
jgi:hypothetical protein